MVQGGYVSSSNAKTLTVNKKANVLNKIPPRGPKNATNNSNATNNNNNNTTISTSSIDVSANVQCRSEFLSKMFFFSSKNTIVNFTGKSIEGIDGRTKKAE